MAFPHKKTMRITVGILGLIAISLAARAWYLEEQGNFHTVTPEEAYRSAQLDRDELRHYARKYHIRSIINLRGKKPGKAWYREEKATAAELGIRHIDYGGIGAVRPPSASDLATLLTLFATAPRPVLLHCQAGADRSGLAAALWKKAVDKTPARQARKQLSLRYGHIPIGPTRVLDTFFEAWASGGSDGPLPGAPAPARRQD